MADLIHEHSARVRAQDGTVYRARTYGAARPDGTWAGWLEFSPTEADPGEVPATRRTGQETSQPDRRALVYWAGGLEPVYLEGALQRALRAD